MKTIRTTLTTTALLLTAAAVAFAANPHIGTWKLNETKSKFSEGATKNHTVSYAEGEAGMITVTVDGKDKDGNAVHWTVQCKFDGKPYKAEGNPNVDMVSYKKVDEHTNKITGTKDDKTVMTGTITVAKDGKSRTVNTTLTGADGKKVTEKAVYDKE